MIDYNAVVCTVSLFLFFIIGNPLPLVPLVDSVNSCSELSVVEQQGQGVDSLSLDMAVNVNFVRERFPS